jgi:Holliday junction resolvase RusA-like endonuclease
LSVSQSLTSKSGDDSHIGKETELAFGRSCTGRKLKFSLNKEPSVARREIPDHAMTLKLPVLPPSTNNLYFNAPGAGRVKTRQYRDWIAQCGLLLKRQITGRLMGRVDITIKLEDKHPRRDASNTVKPIEDLLVELGAIQDDRAKFVRSCKAEWANVEGVVIEISRVRPYSFSETRGT